MFENRVNEKFIVVITRMMHSLPKDSVIMRRNQNVPGAVVAAVPYDKREVTLEILKHYLQCNYVDVVNLETEWTGQQLDMWVDDEGLLTSTPLTMPFKSADWREDVEFFGNGVVCGRTRGGKSIPVSARDAHKIGLKFNLALKEEMVMTEGFEDDDE